jgi:hypothetical protein
MSAVVRWDDDARERIGLHGCTFCVSELSQSKMRTIKSRLDTRREQVVDYAFLASPRRDRTTSVSCAQRGEGSARRQYTVLAVPAIASTRYQLTIF